MTYKAYFSNSGTPTTGLSLTWEYLKKVADGADEGSPPAFTEIGGGWYKFSYAPTEDMAGVIDGSATLSGADRYVPVDFTPADGYLTEAMAELAAVPSATPTFDKAIMWIYMALRNAGTSTASARTIKTNAGVTIGTATISNDGTTFTKGKFS